MKKLGALLLGLLCCIALFGCNKNSLKTKNAGEELAVYTLEDLKKQTTNIEMWHSFGHSITEQLKGLVSKFEEEYANKGINIKVNLVSVGGGYDGLRNRVRQGIKQVEIPVGVVVGYPDHFADYLKGDILTKITPFIESTNEGVGLSTQQVADYVESYWNENNQFDAAKTVYGIPFNKSTEVMTYNATVVDPILTSLGYMDADDTWKNPTWDEVFEVAKRLRQQYPFDSKAKSYPVIYDSTSNFFITTARQWGGAYTSSSSIETGKIEFDNAQVKEALKYFKEKANANLFQIPEGVNQSYSSVPFVAQSTFIAIGSTAGINNSTSTAFSIKCAPVPQKSYDKPEDMAVIQQGTNLAICSKSTDNYQRLASWELIKFLTNASSQSSFSKKTGYMPVLNSVLESEDYKKFLKEATTGGFNALSAKAIIAGTDQKSYFYTDPAFVGSADIRAQVGLVVEQILTGKSSSSDNDVIIQNAIDIAYKELKNFTK